MALLKLLTRLQVLLPQLHDVDPGAEGGVEELRQVALGSPRVGAQVEARVRQPRPQIAGHRAIQSPDLPRSANRPASPLLPGRPGGSGG